MKKIVIIGAGLAITMAAHAECVMRTTSLTKVVGKIDQIADIRPMISPADLSEVKCSISARVEYKGNWFTVYGDYTGDPKIGAEDLCVNAVEIAVRQFLASKEAKLLHSDQQMVCTDEAPLRVRPVQRGEVIRLSEVKLHPNKPPFQYKGNQCLWFVESSVKGNDIYNWNGVVCKTGGPDDWTVVDKF